jgi:adenylosuccinate synthase
VPNEASDTSKAGDLGQHAHLIIPLPPKELDRSPSASWASTPWGLTPGRGIGPAYADKAARIGLRVQDLTDPAIFREKLDVAIKEKNLVLAKVYNRLPLDPSAIAERYLALGQRLAPQIADSAGLLAGALEEGKRVLLEGAQGTLLDLDHGTYPFVTSSSCVAAGLLAGAGLGPTGVDAVIGVAKAYVTRVGSGPFPTEDTGEAGAHIGDVGREFGTVTGRPRRCGWFDAVLARYAARLNGQTELFLTKLDVLSGLPALKVARAYLHEGGRYEDFPPHQSIFHRAEPEFEEFEGWTEDITGVRSFGDLPPAARTYVEAIAKLAGVPVRYLSVGPDRGPDAPGGPVRSSSSAAAAGSTRCAGRWPRVPGSSAWWPRPGTRGSPRSPSSNRSPRTTRTRSRPSPRTAGSTWWSWGPRRRWFRGWPTGSGTGGSRCSVPVPKVPGSKGRRPGPGTCASGPASRRPAPARSPR